MNELTEALLKKRKIQMILRWQDPLLDSEELRAYRLDKLDELDNFIISIKIDIYGSKTECYQAKYRKTDVAGHENEKVDADFNGAVGADAINEDSIIARHYLQGRDF
jgi:hypothetical protein